MIAVSVPSICNAGEITWTDLAMLEQSRVGIRTSTNRRDNLYESAFYTHLYAELSTQKNTHVFKYTRKHASEHV